MYLSRQSVQLGGIVERLYMCSSALQYGMLFGNLWNYPHRLFKSYFFQVLCSNHTLALYLVVSGISPELDNSFISSSDRLGAGPVLEMEYLLKKNKFLLGRHETSVQIKREKENQLLFLLKCTDWGNSPKLKALLCSTQRGIVWQNVCQL